MRSRGIEPAAESRFDRFVHSGLEGIRINGKLVRRTTEAFDESKHPRADDGTFGSGAGSGGGERRVPQPRVAMRQSVTAEEFIAARNKTTRPGYLAPLSSEDLAGRDIVLNKDGTMGVEISREGDIGNLFNNGGPKGGATEMIFEALRRGGKTLDCFDGYLTERYTQFGFEETGRMKFNPEMAPPGWNHERDGAPDVVFMAWKGLPDPPETIRDRIADRKAWHPVKPTSTYHDDYDEAKRRATAAAEENR